MEARLELKANKTEKIEAIKTLVIEKEQVLRRKRKVRENDNIKITLKFYNFDFNFEFTL